MVSDRSAHFFDKHPVVLKFGYPQIRHCDASCSAKSKIRVPSNYPFRFFIYRNPSAACLQQMQCICRQSVHMLRWFCQRSRLSRRPEAPIFGKISRCRQNPEAPIFGKISWFRQNPEVPIFRKICHFRKFLNRQISGKIRGFGRNFRKIWDFWPNCRMYWSNSGYNCRVSDRGAHFFGRRSVLCNNNNIYIFKIYCI